MNLSTGHDAVTNIHRNMETNDTRTGIVVIISFGSIALACFCCMCAPHILNGVRFFTTNSRRVHPASDSSQDDNEQSFGRLHVRDVTEVPMVPITVDSSHDDNVQFFGSRHVTDVAAVVMVPIITGVSVEIIQNETRNQFLLKSFDSTHE